MNHNGVGIYEALCLDVTSITYDPEKKISENGNQRVMNSPWSS